MSLGKQRRSLPSADTDTDSPKFRNPTIEGKRVKEKVYIYIYKYKNILLTFLYFSVTSQEERRGVRKIGLSVSVSAGRKIIRNNNHHIGENYKK